MAQSKGIKLQTRAVRISSPSPSERLGELRMDNPLGPTRAAKSCRLTGNEGPLESKQTAYHEVRHPERQLSHWGWDQFMGNYGLFKTPIWNRFSKNLAVKTGDQWWVVTPSASSRLTSSVLLNAASVTRQPLKKTICCFMHLLSCRYMYTSAWQWDIRTNLERWGRMDVMLTQVLMENLLRLKKNIEVLQFCWHVDNIRSRTPSSFSLWGSLNSNQLSARFFNQ